MASLNTLLPPTCLRMSEHVALPDSRPVGSDMHVPRGALWVLFYLTFSLPFSAPPPPTTGARLQGPLSSVPQGLCSRRHVRLSCCSPDSSIQGGLVPCLDRHLAGWHKVLHLFLITALNVKPQQLAHEPSTHEACMSQ